MTTAAAFIDLPNIYSGLIRTKLADPALLKDYFLEWLDWDLLVSSLSPAHALSSIWVFYSKDKMGPKDARITDRYFTTYIDRINALNGVTARNVDIPGVQREPLRIECNECHSLTTTQWNSEKGIDAALTVHLFDTMDAWDVAYLLSGDADFVPIVQSLRRRGKIINGAGAAPPSPALVRECFTYINLADTFIRDDLVLYKLLNKQGIFATWLAQLKPNSNEPAATLKIELRWPASYGFDNSNIDLVIHGSCNLVALHEALQNSIGSTTFRYQEYDEPQGKHFFFPMSSSRAQVVGRKIGKVIDSVPGLQRVRYSGGFDGFIIEFQYNNSEGKYEVVVK